MPPKKTKKSEGIKKGKIILKPIINALQKKAIEKLEKRININGSMRLVGMKSTYLSISTSSMIPPVIV